MSEFFLEKVDHPESSSVASLRLGGQLELADAPELWRRLHAEVDSDRECTIDLTEVEKIDGVCAAILVSLEAQFRAAGQSLRFTGARAGIERLLELYAIEGNPGKEPPRRLGILEQVGEGAVGLVRTSGGVLAFIGQLYLSGLQAIRRPRTIHWADFGKLLEKAGADSVPIVLAINLLVGFILGLQSAIQMQQFGVGIYVADLVGVSVVRELGPLMTAIIVTGRSGAAYAAQIGTMVVSEEIAALRSMGFDPIRFLVIPRTYHLWL